ncbi:MAG: PTS transporter subunit EIIC [Collinsella sp.]
MHGATHRHHRKGPALFQRDRPQQVPQGDPRRLYLATTPTTRAAVIPIIIFSSIFCLVASVPNIWGFYWPDDINNALWKCYNYSMGILAIACAATTAKHFADAQNRDLPKNNQINFISCMCAAIIGFLLLSSDTIATDAASGFNTTYLGSKGLLTAFIAAFVTGIIYKFFIKRNITVKMPEQVPPNISQTFKDIIPFSICITVFWVFDIVFRAAFGFCFAQGVIQVFQPLFTAADGYIGLAVIYGAMSLFWFVGVHGPSMVEPAIAAALVANMTDNLAAFQAGEHASAVLTQGAQYFVVCMGGTGATLVLVFMFCFLAKSQEMRAVGKAAIVPVCFAVNEPLLFHAHRAQPRLLCPVCLCPDRQHLDPQDLYRLFGHERLYVHPALDCPRPHRHHHRHGLPAARLCDARHHPGGRLCPVLPVFPCL